MALNQLEKESATWKKVKQYCRSELQRLAVANEKSIPLEETENIRGQIRALQKMQSQLAPEELEVVEQDNPYKS